MELLCAAAAWCAAFGGLGAWVAGQKGRAGAEGVVLGVLFGPLGVLIEALLPTDPGDGRGGPGPLIRPQGWRDGAPAGDDGGRPAFLDVLPRPEVRRGWTLPPRPPDEDAKVDRGKFDVDL